MRAPGGEHSPACGQESDRPFGSSMLQLFTDQRRYNPPMPRLLATISSLGDRDPAALTRTALDLGFDAIALDAPLYLPHWEGVRELLPREAVFSIELFLPYPRTLRPGAAPPFSAAAGDPEARRDAQKQAIETVLAAERKAIPFVRVPPIGLEGVSRAEWVSIRAGQPLAEERRASFLARRGAEARHRLDSLRILLSRLLEAADRYGRTVLLVPGGFPDEAPSPRETEALLTEFRGAPLEVWLDTLRVSVATGGASLEGLSLLDSLQAATVRDFEADGSAAEPATGELEPEWAAPILKAAGAWALDSAASSSPEALQAGLEWLRKLAEPPAPPEKSTRSSFLGI